MTDTAARMPAFKSMAPYLQVYDMPIAVKFYRDVLGFTIDMQSEPELGDDCNWMLLKKDGIELMLNTMYEKMNRPAIADQARMSGHADVTLYFACADIDGLYKDLLAKGVKLKEPFITFYGFKAIYLTDPDEYRICFHWPAE